MQACSRLTVLKVVEESNDPYTQQVLVAERRGAAIQKQLRDFDPRFVEIYEYGQMENAFYVAMEYIEGHSVADKLREGRDRVDHGEVAGAEMQAPLGLADRGPEFIAFAPRRRDHVVAGANQALADRKADAAAAAGDEDIMHRCAPVCRPE